MNVCQVLQRVQPSLIWAVPTVHDRVAMLFQPPNGVNFNGVLLLVISFRILIPYQKLSMNLLDLFALFVLGLISPQDQWNALFLDEVLTDFGEVPLLGHSAHINHVGLTAVEDLHQRLSII